MVPTRRQLLTTIGVGITLPLPDLLRTADDTERVFIHPADDTLEPILDLVDDLTGRILFEYEHFPFVAAAIPSDARDELSSDPRIALIEDDPGMGLPPGWSPSLGDILNPGDDTDCSLHPEQAPSWGWERVGADAVDVTGAGVGVGVLDTGIQSDHCDLAVVDGRNFTSSLSPSEYEDGHGHGTHVAGIIGARDNDLGVVGVAPEADLYALKVLDDNGDGSHSTLVAGIDWCIDNDVPIISMSFGGAEASEAADQAIETAAAEGHLIVCAAGNEGNEGDGECGEETMMYPAVHEDVLAVTAMNENETLASYASVGSELDLIAPGTDIESTFVDNGYASANGTSMACPFVTGVAALCWEVYEEDGPPASAISGALRETAEPVLETCEEGQGLVNAQAALGYGYPDDTSGDGGDDAPGGTPPTDDGDQWINVDGEDLPARLEDIRWGPVTGIAGGAVAVGYGVRRITRTRREE